MAEPTATMLATRRLGGLLIGRLADHGAANYQFRDSEDPSYYLKLLTTQGVKVLWGKDLERALRDGETRPRVGDLVGARRVAREAVTITSRSRDSEGRVTSQQDRQAHRTRWMVEKVQFFAERSRLARQVREDHLDVREAVRQRPELKSTFLSVRAAESFAAKKIGNPEDRARFMELVKGALAESIRNGEPLPAVNIAGKSREHARQTPMRTERTR